MLQERNGHQDRRTRELVAARRPGWSLEQPFYTDPAFLELDLERIWRHCWLFAGLAIRIPQPGDYFAYAIGSDSLLFLRGDDGEIRALFNVCRHRGSQICAAPSGHVKKLICPYHQWVYERDGTLASARLMPDDFDKSSFGLHRAHVRVVEGLIFVCFAEDPPDFEPAARDFTAHLKPYRLEQTKIAHTQVYDVRANWKLIMENFRECYHCPVGHPEYCSVYVGVNDEVTKDRQEHWKRLGLETNNTWFRPDTWHLAARYPFGPGFVVQSLGGQPVAPLLGDLTDRDAGTFSIVTYPNFWLEASSDHVWTMRTTPLAPTRCEVETNWLVRADAVEGVGYDVERVIGFWRTTGEQDWKLCEDNQAGVNSSRYRPGPYGPVEGEVETFVNWYIGQLTGG